MFTSKRQSDVWQKFQTTMHEKEETDPLLDVTKICRTCLAEGAPMRSIYSVEDAPGDEATTLCDILSSCSPLKVLPGDGLPENVCTSCTAEMSRAYLFWKLCQKSDAALRRLLEKSSQDEFACELDEPEDHGEGLITEEKPCLEDLIPIKEEREQEEGYQSDGDVVAKKTTTRPETGRGKKTRGESDAAAKKPSAVKVCEICNKSFRYPYKLQRHLLSHSGEKPHLCNVCGKSFAQVGHLSIHMNTHTGEKPYKCRFCDRRFSQPSSLSGHVRSHTGERPFLCKYCGRSFPQTSYLTAHLRSHTGEKPVECKVCSKRFSSLSYLKVHMRVHTGEKPYTCSVCDRSFSTNTVLKCHVRTHTGEKPYSCATCGQAFAAGGSLHTHMKIHRPK